MAAGGLDVFVENLERHSRLLRGGSRTIQLRVGSDKHAELMRQHASHLRDYGRLRQELEELRAEIVELRKLAGVRDPSQPLN
jgi:hypothetical protein